jgi:hypothetical protein
VTDDEPLRMDRIMDLVGDAMAASFFGVHPDAAAAEIVGRRRPSARELAAARRQNQEVHSGQTPEVLRQFMPPTPVPEDVVRLRRMIDDVLVAAERQVEQSHPSDP